MSSGASVTKRRRWQSAAFRLARWTLVGGAVLSILIWLATLPFYYFATPGRNHSFRVETGRINYGYEPRGVNEDSGIAINSEAMRWRLDLRFYPDGSWFVRLPLWIPALTFSSAAAAMFIVRRVGRRRGHCRCGYELTGLVPADGAVVCPECGTKSEVSRRSRGERP